MTPPFDIPPRAPNRSALLTDARHALRLECLKIAADMQQHATLADSGVETVQRAERFAAFVLEERAATGEASVR